MVEAGNRAAQRNFVLDGLRCVKFQALTPFPIPQFPVRASGGVESDKGAVEFTACHLADKPALHFRAVVIGAHAGAAAVGGKGGAAERPFAKAVPVAAESGV